MEPSKNTPDVSLIIKSWVELYTDTLYSWAFYKTSDRETAEDLVQETFIVAFQSFEKFENKSTPKTWLFSILNNKVIDHHRKNFRNPITRIDTEHESDDHDQTFLATFFNEKGHWKSHTFPHEWGNIDEPHLLDNYDFTKTLQTCMEKLPANWFSVMQLKYLQEKGGHEVCQELGITSSNFWQIMHRAKLQLRQCLENNWFNK